MRGLACLLLCLIAPPLAQAQAEGPNCPALVNPYDNKTAMCAQTNYEVFYPDAEDRIDSYFLGNSSVFSGFQDGVELFPPDDVPPSVRSPFVGMSVLRPRYDRRGRVIEFEVGHRGAMFTTPRNAQSVSISSIGQSKVTFRPFLVSGSDAEVPITLRQTQEYRLSQSLNPGVDAFQRGQSSLSVDRDSETGSFEQIYRAWSKGELFGPESPAVTTSPPDLGEYRRTTGQDATWDFSIDIEEEITATPGQAYILRVNSSQTINQGEMQQPDMVSRWKSQSLDGFRGIVSSSNPDVRFELIGTENDSPFLINAGLNDAWYNPAKAGQGMLIIVFPDIKQVFLAWFTYDTERPPGNVRAILGDPGHRWLTAQGPYEGDTAILEVFETQGGVFDSEQPTPATGEPIGSIEVTWLDCESAIVNYRLEGLGLSGVVTLQRVTLDNVSLCESLAEG